MYEPELVLNTKTGKFEKCHVGEGCRLHFHNEAVKKELSKYNNSMRASGDTEVRNQVGWATSLMGGAVGGLTSIAVASTVTALSILPLLGVLAVATVGAGLLTFAGTHLYYAIKNRFTARKIKHLAEQEASRQKIEDANDDITSIEEYNEGI